MTICVLFLPPSLPLKDICISGGFAVALFVGAVPLGVYAGQWGQAGGTIVARIRSATGGSAVSAETKKKTSLKSLATWSPSPW